MLCGINEKGKIFNRIPLHLINYAPISPATAAAAASDPAAAEAEDEGARAKKGFRSNVSNVTRGRMAAAAAPAPLPLAAEPTEASRSTLAKSTAEEAAEARELAESCRWMEGSAGAPSLPAVPLPIRCSTPVCVYGDVVR